MLLRSLLARTGAALSAPARRGAAQPATPPASHVFDLASLFPAARQLPAGLELESAGSREEIAQLAGTFRNSRDAAQLLSRWGWVGNAYRSYAARAGAGSATPARLAISLHAFTSSIGAAYALSYFAHDRAVALQHHEEPIGLLLPCAATVLDDGSATRYLRRGNLLVRVTVVMPRPTDTRSGEAARATATNLAVAILANAGSAAPTEAAFC